jgi:hypothetical protein
MNNKHVIYTYSNANRYIRHLVGTTINRNRGTAHIYDWHLGLINNNVGGGGEGERTTW